MQTILKRTISLVVICLVVCGASAASAFFGRSSRPLIVQFEGQLYPLDGKMMGGLDTITVAMQRKEYLFQVSKVNILGGARDSGTWLAVSSEQTISCDTAERRRRDSINAFYPGISLP